MKEIRKGRGHSLQKEPCCPWSHGGCGQKSFKLVWRCHQLLSGFLAKGKVANKGDNEMILGLCTDLLEFALQLRKTSARRPSDEGLVRPVIASNGVHSLWILLKRACLRLFSEHDLGKYKSEGDTVHLFADVHNVLSTIKACVLNCYVVQVTSCIAKCHLSHAERTCVDRLAEMVTR